jgi:hypothetical protein
MKMLGTLFEQRFVLECLEQGLHPFNPTEDSLPQDFLVLNQANEVFKVQVKGTRTPVVENNIARYKVTASTGNTVKTMVDCSEVDILVAHVNPDAWYIIPCTEITSVRIWLYPFRESQGGQYEKFRDRWDLFAEKPSFSKPDPYCLGRDAETPCNDSWTDAHEESCVD